MILTKIYRGICGFLADDAEKSLLSRDESTAIKGLLMILIVLGHDKFLMDGGYCSRFLYSFHIYDFYFLPFLYDFRSKPLGRLIGTNLKRFYVPFAVTFLALFGVSYATGYHIEAINLVKALVFGTQSSYVEAFGFGSFLWFIPVMFTLLILRWIYYRGNIPVRGLMLGISGLFLFGLSVGFWDWCMFLNTYLPIGGYLAIAMLLPAILARYLFTRISSQCASLIFFALIVCVFIIYPLPYPKLYLAFNRLFCPVLVLLFLLSMRQLLSHSKLILAIGTLSFQIYLIHQFLFKGVYMVCEPLGWTSPLVGLAIFPLVLAAAYLLGKVPFMKYIFPK